LEPPARLGVILRIDVAIPFGNPFLAGKGGPR
jgi:hypothetical protein